MPELMYSLTTVYVYCWRHDHHPYANPQAADFVVNTGIGFAVGVVGSVLLFRREYSTW